ncbi:MAG TPA: hypothetical protein PKM89_01920, partial [Bacteroidales bacterium]|nr:hypothetical protein [Bacteroidales bacterium]
MKIFISRLRDLLAPALIMLLTGVASAQMPPGLLNFQGRLTDTANNPLSGPHDFTFSMYDSAMAGNQLWSETRLAVTVANGVLAVEFGASTPIQAAVFANSAVYLQINVDGVDLSPRQRLITSPYAFNAYLLGGKPAGSYVSTEAVTQAIAGDKTFSGVLSAVSETGVISPALRLSWVNVYISSEAAPALGGGVRISSNVYIVGFASATKFYGDGSGLSNISSDGMGPHTASMRLDMAGFPIINASSITVSAADPATGYSLRLSSGLLMPAGTLMAGYLTGDGGGLFNLLASSVAAGGVRPGSLSAGAIVASDIAESTISLNKLNQSG